jgi:predicted phage terminase large subunit-like protein
VALRAAAPPPPAPVVASLLDAPAPPPPAPATEPPKKKRGRPKEYIPWAHDRPTPEQVREDLEEKLVAMAIDPEGRQKLLKLLDAQAAKGSFAEFFRQAWRVVEPTTELVWNWHLQLICNVVQALFMDWLRAKKDRKYVNKIRNVIFNVPPGSSKSRILSVCFQAWAWLHWPGMKFICLSVNDDATMRDARAVRDLIRSDWYLESFRPEWTIKEDQDAVSNWGNTSGGERLSMASRSVVVGLRGDCILIDDANDPTETDKERTEVNTIWEGTQYNRVNDQLRSLRIGVQQRTGAGDWTDHVIDKQGAWSPENTSGWLHVILPAEYESERRFVLPDVLVEILREHLPEEEWIFADPRTAEGETIDKLRMPPEVLAAERKRWEGTGNYAAQMQQRPALAEGALVKRNYWGWFRLEHGVRPDIDEFETGRPRPAHCTTGDPILVRAKTNAPGHWDFDWVCISLDCAVKKTERGSNWGIIVAAGKEGRRYVLDDRTRRGDILHIVEVLRELILVWRPDKILIEDKAAGPDLKMRLLAEMSRGDMPMIELVEVKVDSNTGKEARLDACISVIANGLVMLLDGAPWLEEFVEELAMFPHGRRSDRVDSITQILNYFKEYEEDDWPDL